MIFSIKKFTYESTTAVKSYSKGCIDKCTEGVGLLNSFAGSFNCCTQDYCNEESSLNLKINEKLSVMSVSSNSISIAISKILTLLCYFTLIFHF